MKCMYSESEDIVKSGINRVSAPKYICEEYSKEFIDRLLLETLSLAGLSRVKCIRDLAKKRYK